MNNIRCLEFMNNDTFCHLKVLNLEGNAIENWEEVNKLGQLPWYVLQRNSYWRLSRSG